MNGYDAPSLAPSSAEVGVVWSFVYLAVGARYSVTSCDLRILVDQTTEPIASNHPASRHEIIGSPDPSGGACPNARCGRWKL
jgi:hypothetical protein